MPWSLTVYHYRMKGNYRATQRLHASGIVGMMLNFGNQ